ncbi:MULTISPECIES: mechanosensitive ion channel family protein [Chromobacterium]|uniref:Small-conductance mechanosensitive channel n=2 Tax=Chromobacterium TaxID=535 RepID=A0ABS3GT48_9NEIS|nr:MULTISPECIES: mechanosensitive ion channel family protein [Chromobacterium]AXT48768.1 mechanosensitive ion channel family protein [Chromobacterium rhizoryzae]MBK0417105.1 mechanosensitive ion channel family protein [Chromobacterium haemolyticum]MBO0418231.1 mechanosensitive ion channel family protein [Chromobacterium haemolyticum]MBO0501556.1 mechanosensitive ion channel family protein [Chromobacterium haemolyticum]MDH0341437.1 mechanosensitive ion channel family protein [Chromobacterium ha
MDAINWSHWSDLAVKIGLNIVSAILLWLVGRWLINFATRLLDAKLASKSLDHTIRQYVKSFLDVTLTIVLVIGILGFFGVQTTTFAAVIAAAGVAVGMAWSGLLANFAAGIFLVVLRPFKVGDLVGVAGVVGTVKHIGLFATAVDTPDGVLTLVGNNKIFSDTIQNFSATEQRRVDLKAQLAASADHAAAMSLLRETVAKVPNVLASPAPDVGLLEFTPLGPVLAVRPYCKPQDYWQVYFDSNRVIRETLAAGGFPAPEQAMVVRQS